MAEKSKRQLKMEEYFKQNGIEYDKNFVYGINKKRKKFEFVTEIFCILRRENIDLCFQY